MLPHVQAGHFWDKKEVFVPEGGGSLQRGPLIQFNSLFHSTQSNTIFTVYHLIYVINNYTKKILKKFCRCTKTAKFNLPFNCYILLHFDWKIALKHHARNWFVPVSRFIILWVNQVKIQIGIKRGSCIPESGHHLWSWKHKFTDLNFYLIDSKDDEPANWDKPISCVMLVACVFPGPQVVAWFWNARTSF